MSGRCHVENELGGCGASYRWGIAAGGDMTATATLDFSLLNLVAHEMRAPLTVIKGYSSMLRDGTLSDVGETMDVIDGATHQLDELADTLITAARLESAEVPCQPSVFDVAEAVAEAYWRVEARARLEQAVVAVQPPACTLVVSADRSHVVRILTNLLNNALTYSHRPAGVAVEVRHGPAVEVAVHDSGVGIVPEWQGRIFERFTRYAEHGAGRPAGMGLGLPISRDLAELNGGELFLERSAPGEGSVFVLRLPLARG